MNRRFPGSWLPAIQNEARRVLGSGARGWLITPNPRFCGQSPSRFAIDRLGARMVMDELSRLGRSR